MTSSEEIGTKRRLWQSSPGARPRHSLTKLQWFLHPQGGLFYPLFGLSLVTSPNFPVALPFSFVLSRMMAASTFCKKWRNCLAKKCPSWFCLLLPFLCDLWFEAWVVLRGLEPLYTALLKSARSNLPLTPHEIWGLYLSKLAACLTGLWKGLQNAVVISGRDSFCLCTHLLSLSESQGLTGSLYTLSIINIQRGGKKKPHRPKRLLPWNKAGNVIKNFNYNWHFWFCCCRRPPCQNWHSKAP